MKRSLGTGVRVVVTCVGLLASAAASAGAQADAAGEASGGPPAQEAALADEIRGSVVFNGCVVKPAELIVRAVPLAVKGRDGGLTFPVGRNVVRTGRVSPSADPNVLRFSIRGLAPRAAYQVGISNPPARCGPMFWRGPEQGLALTGGRPILIEGFAATTQVSLFSARTDSWVGADDLDFTDPAASTRVLRWRSSLPGVVGGELQLSTEPFPRAGAFSPCDEPAGAIFHRQPVRAGARNTWVQIEPIDFGPLLAPGRAAPVGTAAVTPETQGMLLLGAPIYARVVPQTAEGPACNGRRQGVPGWVIAANLPKGDVQDTDVGDRLLQAWGVQSYTPPVFTGHPALGQVGYRVIKAHVLPPLHPSQMTASQYLAYGMFDPMGLGLVGSGMAKPGQVLVPGQSFAFYPKSSGGGGGGFLSGFTSTLGGLVTATVGALGDLVDYMAKITEEIKSSVAKAVVDIATLAPGVGPACSAIQSVSGKSCEDVVRTGMEYGLTTMGVPPSLPNWDQLQAQGIDYLAAEVATQIGDPTGLSGVLTEQVLTTMVDTTLDKISADRPGVSATANWVNRDYGLTPAVWTFGVRKNDPLYLPDDTFIRVTPGPLPTPLFAGTNVHVPARFPESGELRIPVVLQPLMSGIAPPLCQYDRYHGTNVCKPNPGASQPICQYRDLTQSGKYVWKSYPCENTDYTQIYYRDAWLQQKLYPTTCVIMTGVSASNTSGLWLPDPNPPFVAAAGVNPMNFAIWMTELHFEPGCE